MRIKTFDTGTQFADWRHRNCERCALRWRDNRYFCLIERALDEAYIGDGYVDDDIAARMGYSDTEYTWDCPERITR
ncbi:hypothetical protein AC812_10615 [Bellilinea caldifistulae]|uniref:Uncharacterized protein n=1 Tax=Bellilinea caldifistulae TaxID=360411 RepID=A0A0P6XHJ3_9CHLR|nr:hypothetical protein AC812_10615 [Bellilinea caldifistulae]